MVGKVSEVKNIGHRAFLLGKKRAFQVITLLYLLCLPLQNRPGSTEQERTSQHEVTAERAGLCKHCPGLALLQKHSSTSCPSSHEGLGTAELTLCAQSAETILQVLPTISGSSDPLDLPPWQSLGSIWGSTSSTLL